MTKRELGRVRHPGSRPDPRPLRVTDEERNKKGGFYY